jgi:hypothetical protein
MIDIAEYDSRLNGRLFGFYAAVVKDIDDPLKLGRVRVVAPNVYGESLSPWCSACFSMALGVDKGSVTIPALHSYVWISFEEGDPSAPIYFGGFAVETVRGRPSDGGAIEEMEEYQRDPSPLMAHARGVTDGTDSEASIRNYKHIPPTSYAGEYGRVNITRTQSGHVFELNDTEGASRIFLLHGPSGAYYEMRHDGTIVEATGGTKRTVDSGLYASHEGSSRVEYTGTLEESFGGAYSASYLGRYSASLSGATVDIRGGGLVSNFNAIEVFSQGAIELNSTSDIGLFSGGDVAIGSSGSITQNALADFAVVATNALDATGLTNCVSITGMNGKTLLQSSDRAGLTLKGIEANYLGGVFLGNLTTTSEVQRALPTAIPVQKEGVVMGVQLSLALAELIGHLTTYTTLLSSGGVTPGFGGPNPILAAANVALTTQLSAWLLKYAPLPTTAQPLYASDQVFVSK